MRIIGGQHRGLTLAAVGKGDASAHLRPTSDRVRESLFNVLLGGRFGDPITDAHVLDLFAGTGALGLEALSRGAAHATFVDNGRIAQKLIRENIAKCKRQTDATLLSTDITHLPPAAAPCTLIFADPPYGKGLGQVALNAATQAGWIAEDALIVLEDNVALPAPLGFAILDQRRYGDTWITLLEPASMTPKLVLFDCDGVLVDTEPVTDALISASLTRYGLPLSPHQVSTMFVGGTIQGVADEARRQGADLPADWVDQTYAEMFVALSKGVPVFDGVHDILDRLDAAGIITAIVSNGPMRKMEVSLTPHALKDRFGARIYSGHDYVPKPDPTMIHVAMREAGVTRAETVFIDDSLNGAKAGIAAGVRTFGFAPQGDDGSRAKIGAEPVMSMAQIAGLIGL